MTLFGAMREICSTMTYGPFRGAPIALIMSIMSLYGQVSTG